VTPLLIILIEIVGVISVVQILSISPAIKIRRPVQFTQPKREGTSALSLTVLIIIFTALLTQMTPQTMAQMIPFQTFLASMQLGRPVNFSLSGLVFQLGLSIILMVPFLFGMYQRKQPWLSVGLKKQMLKGGFQVGFALVLVTIFLRGKINILIYGAHSLEILYLLLGCLIVCFAEEFIFRGFVQLRLTSWLGEMKGWLATAALYSFWSVLPLLNAPLETILITAAYRLGMGLLLGWIMRKSGSIIGGWLYHAVHIWLFWL
jgi:membrane protease YdiL (CAAX protease family)